MLPRNLFAALALVLSAFPVAAESFLSSLPVRAKVYHNFSPDSLRTVIATQPLHHVEGIWMFTESAAVIAIIRRDDMPRNYSSEFRGYEMILLQSPDRALRPGTVVGHLVPSARRGVYEASVYTMRAGSWLVAPARFNLTLEQTDDEARLLFQRKKKTFSINPWRLLPYMWRYAVVQRLPQASVSGCVRIFPAPERPLEPIYL